MSFICFETCFYLCNRCFTIRSLDGEVLTNIYTLDVMKLLASVEIQFFGRLYVISPGTLIIHIIIILIWTSLVSTSDNKITQTLNIDVHVAWCRDIMIYICLSVRPYITILNRFKYSNKRAVPLLEFKCNIELIVSHVHLNQYLFLLTS